MPYTEKGITPDILINTNSLPSRMILGQLLENSLGKVCARLGATMDGTAFLPVSHDDIARELTKYGFRYNGRERMFNGATGDWFDAAIFIGTTYEQRLQKFVYDDEYSVAGSGPTDATTGQPLGGKNRRGGLRLGEMEGWALAAHGSVRNWNEKFSKDSDGREDYICRCGTRAVYNARHGIYQCKRCKEAADISEVPASKSAIVFQQEASAINVRFQLGLRPREFEERVGVEVPDEKSADELKAVQSEFEVISAEPPEGAQSLMLVEEAPEHEKEFEETQH